MRSRVLASSLLTAVVALLLLAPVAMADRGDGGEGTWGETNDKVITNAGFIVIAFFPAFILVMSLIQWKLEKRKDEAKKAARARTQREEWRGGW